MRHTFKCSLFTVCLTDISAGAILLGLFLSGAAAQESTASHPSMQVLSDDQDDDADHKVIITAQKRSEQLQNAPISVTAFDAAKLEQMGIESVADVARQTPGLTVNSSGPGQNILIVRGISSTAGTAGTVGYYLDDTPISASSNASLLSQRGLIDPSLFDITQVEVLRGPQGTLYGSSSMGGTVKYLTKQPNLNTLQFNADTTLSNTESGGWNTSTNVMLNVPISDNVAAFRLAVFDRQQDGYIDRYPINPNNYLTGVTSGPRQDNVNTEKTTGYRALLKIRLEDDLSMTASVFSQHTYLGAPFQIDVPPGSLHSLIQTRFIPEPSTQATTLANFTMNKSFDQFELLSTTSYYDRQIHIDEDTSKVLYYFFSPAPQAYVYPSVMRGDYLNHEYTQEFRFTSYFSGPLQFIGGAFYHHVEAPLSSTLPTPPGYNNAFRTQFDVFFDGTRKTSVVEKAVFGEGSYAITPQLTARIGLRAFWVDQTFSQQSAGVLVGPTPSNVNGVSSDQGVNPKFNLGWQVDNDLLLYATASEGYRPGGPNNPTPQSVCGSEVARLNLNSGALSSFGADSLWNYELGEKAVFLDGTLFVNSSVYYIDWKKVQQQIDLQCGFNITVNFGSATSKGIELEMNYQPVNNWNLRLAGNYTSALLGNDVPGTTAKKGDELLYVPKWTAAASAEYRTALFNGMPAYARVDYTYTGNSISLYDTSSPFYQSKAYNLINFRVGTKQLSADSRWGLSMFVDNVLNKIGQTSLPEGISADLPTTRRIGITRPRTIGINLSYRM